MAAQFDLRGKVALVTGASSGIGRAATLALARNGAAVVINYYNNGRGAAEVVNEVQAMRRNAWLAKADVTQRGQVTRMIEEAIQNFGRLDVLVNNAGVLHQGLLGMVPAANVRESFDLNVIAMIALTQYAVRIMDAEHSPSIVNLASIGGTRGLEGAAVYSASKGAVVAFTRSSAKELATKGIRVNAIAPGFIETEMTDALSEKWHAKRLESIAMGRAGTPQEVANVALFLASSLAGYVTGQVLGVDGGMAG